MMDSVYLKVWASVNCRRQKLRRCALALATAVTMCSGMAGAMAQSPLQAWGYNHNGQVGDGTTTLRTAPVSVLDVTDILALASQRYHNLALKSDGTVWAWGNNESGQLGDGTYANRTRPVAVASLAGVAAVSVGGYHSLALKNDGTVWAWGWNADGQLGDASYFGASAAPTQTLFLTDVVSIGAGYVHSLAVKHDGTVWAWGQNTYYGQIGDGTYITRHTPVQVVGLTDMVSVAGGFTHSVALKRDGTVWAWGANSSGELGDGTTTYRLTPVQVQNLAGVTAIAAGGYFTLALKSDGTVWAWGANLWGQLGDGTITNRLMPVRVSAVSEITEIGAGTAHSHAVKSDGTVWAWGQGSFGQMANADYVSVNSVPQRVSGVTEAAMIQAGEAHSIVLRGGAVVGQIFFEGIAGTAPPQDVTFTFTPSNRLAFKRTLAVSSIGTYSLSNIAPGTYAVSIKSSKHLAKVMASVTVTANGTTTLNTTLKAGDANNDNAVDIGDLLLLIAHYNKTQSTGGYLEAADFDGDGANDITDLLLLIGNYNQIGD